mgnify:CR=1 FL=1
MTLKIIKATYFDPNTGPEHGTDVTNELSAEIRNGRLFYKGVYNLIFPDHFKRIHKRLKVELEYNSKSFPKFYNENEKIDLPDDLGVGVEKWWEKTWIQIIVLLGALAGIVGLVALFK